MLGFRARTVGSWAGSSHNPCLAPAEELSDSLGHHSGAARGVSSGWPLPIGISKTLRPGRPAPDCPAALAERPKPPRRSPEARS